MHFTRRVSVESDDGVRLAEDMGNIIVNGVVKQGGETG